MLSWNIVLDASGHYRALHARGRLFDGDEVIDSVDTYLDACKKAGDLNQVAEVMES